MKNILRENMRRFKTKNLNEDTDPTDQELGTWAMTKFGQSKIPADLKQAIGNIRSKDPRDPRTYPQSAWDWVKHLSQQKRSHLTILYNKWKGVRRADDDALYKQKETSWWKGEEGIVPDEFEFWKD